MQNINYLSTKRLYNYPRKYEKYDQRSDFQKDYHNIITSSAFRRLQDKTQVFPLDKSDYVRTRLTHSLEVASIARSIVQASCNYFNSKDHPNEKQKEFAKQESMLSDIVQCAALLHDIGNPPFGHFGETIIGTWFKKNLDSFYDSSDLTDQMRNDLTNFEGNAQALRIITRLQNINKESASDFTSAVLNSIIKYPIPSNFKATTENKVYYHKFGYFLSEVPLFNQIVNNTGYKGKRYILTYILEAADDIAYRIADTDDALKKGLITPEQLFDELKHNKYGECCGLSDYVHLSAAIDEFPILSDTFSSTDKKGQLKQWFTGIQSKLISAASFSFTKNFNEILNGTYAYDLFEDSYSFYLMQFFKDIAKKYIFESPELLKLEIAANEILQFLLDKFCNAVIDYDPLTDTVTGDALHQKLCSLISENYKNVCQDEFKWLQSQFLDDSEKNGYQLYFKLLLVTDFISGMTDSYAKRLYHELKGINL